MSGLSLLLRLRVKPLGKLFSRSGGMDSRKRLQYGASAIFGVIFFVVALTVSTILFGSVLSGGGATGALGSLSNIAVVVLLIPAFGAAFYTVYLSRELDLLAAMPIREGAILSYKFWETLFVSSGLHAIFVLPALAAYGLVATTSFGAAFLYYPVLLVVSVLLAMIPVGVCIIVLMPVMRLIPTGRFKELLAVTGSLFGIAAYFFSYRLFGSEAEPESVAGPSAIASLQPLLESPLARLPPGMWAANALSGATSLQWAELFSGLAPLAVLAGVIYAACLTVARWAYATGRARAAESGGRVRTATGARGTAVSLFRRLAAPLPPEARAVAAKKLKLLPSLMWTKLANWTRYHFLHAE